MTPDAWVLALFAFIGAGAGGYAAPTASAWLRGFVVGLRACGAIHRHRRGGNDA